MRTNATMLTTIRNAGTHSDLFWDTDEATSLAQNSESVYLDCDRLARKYRAHPKTAARLISSAVIRSGILDGSGVCQRRIDWHAVASVFIDSLE